MALGRPLEAVRATDLGLSFFHGSTNDNIEILEDTRRRAQQQLLANVIKGRWKGCVHPTLGGYEQMFDFRESQANSNVSCDGVSNTMAARMD